MRYDKELTTGIDEGTVHLAHLVLEDTQVQYLLDEIIGIFAGVFPGDSEKHEHPTTDIARYLAVNRNLGALDPLDDSTHLGVGVLNVDAIHHDLLKRFVVF